MNRESIKAELLDRIAAATKSTMVGDQAIGVMQAQALVEEALTRGTNLGHMKALDIVGSRRLELACNLAGFVTLAAMIEHCTSQDDNFDGATIEENCRDALRILDTMVDLINGDAK